MSGIYTIGVDFGSESARALLLDMQSGVEIAVSEMRYPHGVLDRELPSGVPLGPDWALQDPADYLATLTATVREVVTIGGVTAESVVAIGIAFTSCTMLPVSADGTPLCQLAGCERLPHAWPKMWKHHAAQRYADRINELGAKVDEPLLARFGGKISSEWLVPKVLQILEEAPEVAARADRMIEAQDWLVWQLCGREVRSIAGAVYKAMYLPDRGGYPDDEFLRSLHPDLPSLVHRTMGVEFTQLGTSVGTLDPTVAARLGLSDQTRVCSPNMDAVASIAASGVTEPGAMLLVMGTSTCDFVLGKGLVEVEGMCGVAHGMVTPDTWVFEAGQNGVGDLFGWFVRECLPQSYFDEAATAGVSPFEYLEELATRIGPGAHGLMVLDWWSGNRSVLVDAGLSGLIVGFTLGTRAEEIYRALLESTAFGTRRIVDAFQDAGVTIERLVTCGGLPHKSPLLMQLYADITGLPVEVVESRQIPARGAALHAAVAAGPEAGGYASITEAAAVLASPILRRYLPDPAHQLRYDEMYRDYLHLHDHFGRDGTDIMRRLKDRRHAALVAAGYYAPH